MSNNWEERVVNNPSHYKLLGMETIEIIARSMTLEQWRGFCLGNVLKYRIRAGKKGEVKQCLKKAERFEFLFEEHKNKTIKENLD